MEVFRYKTKEEARAKAADGLDNLFREISGPVLFLSSGGSSLELLNGLQIGENVTVSVLDERYSTDPAVNNFVQLFERIRPNAFIDTRVGQNEILEQLAERFEKELRMWKEKNPEGKIVITQGMGFDGHVAGIMPYPENRELFRQMFENRERWVVGYDAAGKNQYPLRITVTFPFLRQVDYSIGYIMGEAKRDALSRVTASEGSLPETPGRILREMKSVKIFTDIDKPVHIRI